jgi:hypothetical protein
MPPCKHERLKSNIHKNKYNFLQTHTANNLMSLNSLSLIVVALFSIWRKFLWQFYDTSIVILHLIMSLHSLLVIFYSFLLWTDNGMFAWTLAGHLPITCWQKRDGNSKYFLVELNFSFPSLVLT